MKKIIWIAFLAIVASTSNAELPQFTGDGYYWYKDPIEEKEEPQTPPPVMPPPPPAKPDSSKPLAPEEIPLSGAWLQKNVDILRMRAIDDPTEENLKNYMYVQRVLMDKSQQFALMANQVVKSDPFLDEENRVPSSQYATVLFSQKSDRGKKEVFNFMAENGGIWFFTDTPAKCSACDTYKNNIIKTLVTRHKFKTSEINVSTPEGMMAAKRLGLKVTPATIYARPRNPNEPESDTNKDATFVLSEGLLSVAQLEDRLIIAANMGKMLTPELSQKANPYMQGVLTKDDFAGMKTDDPSEVMKAFRERINNR